MSVAVPSASDSSLKRPDLKGEYTCSTCCKKFCHSASLFRHRMRFHIENHECLLCQQILSAETGVSMRDHMVRVHQVSPVFSCGCCSWVFANKRDLYAHNQSMLNTGTPGATQPIARATKSVEKSSMASKKAVTMLNANKNVNPGKTSPKTPKKVTQLQGVMSPELSDYQQWLNEFIFNNADLNNLVEAGFPEENAVLTEAENVENPGELLDAAQVPTTTNQLPNSIPETKEQSVSPVPSVSSTYSNPQTKRALKRKSIDDIGSSLLLKKLCALH